MYQSLNGHRRYTDGVYDVWCPWHTYYYYYYFMVDVVAYAVCKEFGMDT